MTLTPPLDAAQSPAAQFLNLGFGARALGMGEAFTAVADDVSCVYYNPAGLARGAAGRQLAFSHAWHVQDTAVSQAGFMRRPYAASLTYFSAGELEGRDAAANPTGNFTARDLAFGLSRGLLLGGLQAGVTGKVISQKIKSSGATSFAADLGLLYRFEGTPYSVGAALLNFGTRVKFEEESFPLPLKLKMGAAAAFSSRLLLAVDAELPDYGQAAARLGAEYRGLEGIALRFGYRTASSAQRDAILGRGFGDSVTGVDAMYGFFAGVGFEYSGFNLDYALLPYGDLGSAHRFSFGVRF
ncbi:MAG TPA: hypothetical protein DCS63_02375 [Elusimicrobia bacterium]|nr:hypothetical protein [Elusimicrobiota bacterium]